MLGGGVAAVNEGMPDARRRRKDSQAEQEQAQAEGNRPVTGAVERNRLQRPTGHQCGGSPMTQ